ncbi:VWA domain-containing protein [Azohydromonas lata]|uniref:VWA domain-containing protein n=1 Tax=Azohydromonas lata TaxID=45677 RepID=A0ABU5IA64_9BURK|nr:VWA domain-containing protein [Azohydromonas lata]MDZ5455996.1 VWA domain-containing protein [Azohydromonas lata]
MPEPQMEDGGALDRPYDRLSALPRALWLPTLIASAGERAQRLADARIWLDNLVAGTLPPVGADFGDAAAAAPLRRAVGELGLPTLARGVGALAEQVLRTLLWYLDRIVDHQPWLTRAQAIARVAEDFKAEWQLESAGLEEQLALLRSLGDLGHMRWDELHGQLHSRSWQAARKASEWLQQLPALVTLIRRLGRAERSAAAPAPQAQESPRAAPPAALRAVETRLLDAPGEIVGVRFSSRPERMLAGEAVMLTHPVLKKLWRARHAEARLLSWETQAVLTDWRVDPQAPPQHHAAQTDPVPLERGPIILCLDTSGSMRGAPENIAKAVAIAALRAANEQGRACKLIAFGGPGEVLERDLGSGAAGLQALLELMGQSFDGGTDIQTPIERALERVHEARWQQADVLLVSDGEFGCTPHTLQRLEQAQQRFGLRVQGVLVGDRETMGLLEVCDDIHWVRDWRRYADAAEGGDGRGFSPVHSKSLTALYFPNALSQRAARHGTSNKSLS